MKMDSSYKLKDFSKMNFQQNFYGNEMQAFMVLKNIISSNGYSIFDVKCFLTEDYQRYCDLQDPDKLESNGRKNYLNFQGLSIKNSKSQRVFYTKNYIKYDDLSIQRLLLEKMFSINNFDNQIDDNSVHKLKKKIKVLGEVLRKYQISFESSSLLILYDSNNFKIKMKYLDFSYLPGKLVKTDLLGLDLAIHLMDQIIQQEKIVPVERTNTDSMDIN
jgi:hypothetical protein